MMNASTPSHHGSAWLTCCALLCAGIYLSGCSTFPDWLSSRTSPAQPPVPSDSFLLPPEGTDVIGFVQRTTARQEDTLSDIARRYDLGYEEIVAANPDVDPWLPGKGTQVVLPTQFVLPDAPREGLVLNLAAMRLFYYPPPAANESPRVITHPIGIGREGWQTPLGTSRITEKIVQPKWTVPASIRREHEKKGDPLPAVVPPGPDNPLGEFAMRLSLPSYLIHGTNQPWGVGLRVSHGCVRLYPEDIEQLFPQVPKGTRVTIVNQPYVAGWHGQQLYLEAHAPLAEDAKRWGDSLKPMERAVTTKAKEPAAVNWDKAKQVAHEARGIPIAVSPGSPDFTEILTAAPQVPSIPPWALDDDPDQQEPNKPVQAQSNRPNPRIRKRP